MDSSCLILFTLHIIKQTVVGKTTYDFFHLRSAHQLHSMAGSPRIVMATLLPLLVHFTTCSDHTTHYVIPTANTPCPADRCLTLSEYAQQTHHWLTSNTTLLFLPGDHVLSVNFTVDNVSDFEIYAQLVSFPDRLSSACIAYSITRGNTVW